MGSAGWRMAHPSCQPRSPGAGGRPCNCSKFLLSLAAGLGCRSRPGATSTNGHQPLCWCCPCLQVHNQPTTQQSDRAHDGRPPPSLDSLPPGRDWQEVPSTWLGLRLLPWDICMESREKLPALPGNVGELALSGPSCTQTIAWCGFFWECG